MKKFLWIICFLPVYMYSQSASVFSNSSYGLGMPYHYLSARAMGMGDAGLAASDSNNLNLLNYSQWASIRYTQFQIGFVGEQSFYSSAAKDGELKNSGLSGVMLAIPLKQRKLSMFFNLLPLNHLYFNGYEKLGDSLHFEREYFLERKGDAFQLNGGFAYQWNSYLATSLQILYNLGSYHDQYRIFFTSDKYTDIQYKYEYTLNVFGIGLSQTVRLKHNALGVYMHKYFNGKFERILSKGYDTNQKVTKSFRTSLPFEIGAGISREINKIWLIALDVNFKDYSSGIPTFIDSDTLFNNFYRIGLGIEKQSKADRFEPIIKRMIWRIGSFYGTEGYKVHGHGLINYGITLGAGIPLNYYGGRLDLALQIGKRGSKSLNGREEYYVKFGVELRTLERWFKRFQK